MIGIHGTYVKCLFFNGERGDSAFLVEPLEESAKDYAFKGLIKVVGKFCLQQKDFPLYMKGEWKKTDYGNEFHVSDPNDFSESFVSEEKTISFLESLGASMKTIRAITRAIGYDLYHAIETNDSLEDAIRGCDKSEVSQVIGKAKSLKYELELFNKLITSGGTYDHVMKIIKKYPEHAWDMLCDHGYEVFESMRIPFKLIDKISLEHGVDPLSEARIRAIVLWCIRRESNSGNVYMTFKDICRSVDRAFQGTIPKAAVLAALSNHPYITKDPVHDGVYYETVMFKDEKLAAREFARLIFSAEPLPFHPEYIKMIEDERGFPFGSQQRQAFQLLHSTGIKLLTGDPGTGKTTTVNGLLKYLEKIWIEKYKRKAKFALCAPSGRAAQRMKETTNRNALTIHKLLEFQPYDGNAYYKDGSDPIDADIIVVDEVSMLGLSTFSKLLAAIRSGSLVIMIGDRNQLQSVEAGCVLQDIIEGGFLDSCHLTEVFRQAEESLINVNAKKIMHGDTNMRTGSDFKYQQTSNENETNECMQKYIRGLISQGIDPNSIQVLAPVKKGKCGVKDGNTTLQGIFNPGRGGVYYGYRNFRLNDRVIMTSNNYSLQYFNGDIGYIKSVDNISMKVKIGENEVTIPKENYCDVDLAYNCTIHKSQGSEYENLVIILQEEAKGMLDQNLFYTAVTRGKKTVMVIFENDCMSKSIVTKRTKKRNSFLIERISTELRNFYLTRKSGIA